MRRAVLLVLVALVTAALPAQALAADPKLPTVSGGAGTEIQPQGGIHATDAITLELSTPSDPAPTTNVQLTATLSVDPGGGNIHFEFENYTFSQDVAVGPGGITTLAIGALPAGHYILDATFGGFGPYVTAQDQLEFDLEVVTGTTIETNHTSAYQNEIPVTLTATVDTQGGAGTTVTFLDTVGADTVDLGPVAVDAVTKKASYTSSMLRVGSHSIVARYDAGPGQFQSTSDPITVTILADTTVHATFAPSLATFYPYADGYRDVVALKGVLSEKASVLIRVYSSTGSLKRSWSLGTRNPGAYSVTWNGKTASGTSLSAGKYKVTATFKDSKAHVRTITAYTTLSYRQAKWVAATPIVKYGDKFAYYATPGAGLYYSNDYSHGRIMDTGDIDRNCFVAQTCIQIYATGTFQLKTTGVLDYRHVYPRVVGHGFSDRSGSCTGYSVDPVSKAWVYESPLPYYWEPSVVYNLTPSRSMISTSGQYKPVLSCTSSSGDAFDVHYVKMVYEYAVWK